MRRWTEKGGAPGSTNPNNAYGSAIHLAISVSEETGNDQEAIDAAVAEYGAFLEPEDVEQLEEDLDIYHARDYSGVETVASEDNLRVPLMEHNGETIYYRFTLDRLYRIINNPTAFIHLDYKSSAHRKSDKDVHRDPQLWTYNWAIYEMWPEVEDLTQIYDQLRFGSIPTRKNDSQREKIKRWLVSQVTAILNADHVDPSFNQWCPWCPIMVDCSEPKRTAEFAKTRIAELAPDGTDVANLAAQDIDTYVDPLYEFETVRKCIERYEEAVKGVIRELPQERRRELGFGLFPAAKDVWSVEGLRLAHSEVGDDFYHLVGMTKTRIKSLYGSDKEKAGLVLQHAEKEQQNPRLKRLNT